MGAEEGYERPLDNHHGPEAALLPVCARCQVHSQGNIRESTSILSTGVQDQGPRSMEITLQGQGKCQGLVSRGQESKRGQLQVPVQVVLAGVGTYYYD